MARHSAGSWSRKMRRAWMAYAASWSAGGRREGLPGRSAKRPDLPLRSGDERQVRGWCGRWRRGRQGPFLAALRQIRARGIAPPFLRRSSRPGSGRSLKPSEIALLYRLAEQPSTRSHRATDMPANPWGSQPAAQAGRRPSLPGCTASSARIGRPNSRWRTGATGCRHPQRVYVEREGRRYPEGEVHRLESLSLVARRGAFYASGTPIFPEQRKP